MSVFLISLSTCKKKTNIRVKLINPALDEYVANATVVLVERKGSGGGGLFGGTTSCKEIASCITDANGECFFDKEKLRNSKNYDYFCAVKESWGATRSYPCDGKTSRFLSKGKTQDWLMTDYADGYIRVQYNNLLSPSQPNDSLDIRIRIEEYYDPIVERTQGGGGVFVASPYHDTMNPPNNPPVILLPPIKTLAGRQRVIIRKIKMGVLSTENYIVKVYPEQTTTVIIDW